MTVKTDKSVKNRYIKRVKNLTINVSNTVSNTVSKIMPMFKIKVAVACKIQYLNVLNNVLKFVSNSQYIVFTRYQFIKLKILNEK